MADNGSQNPFNGGDILGAISDDITLIHKDTTDILSDTRLLQSIDKNLDKIISNSVKWSQQDARSRIYDTTRNSGGNSSNQSSNRNDAYNRRPGNNSRRTSNNSGRTDDFIDSFFNEIEESILGSGFKTAVQQNMKELASELGVEVQDIPSLFGKTLAKQLQNTDIGKDITKRLQDAVNTRITRSMNRMRDGVNNYYARQQARGNISGQDAADQQGRYSNLIDRMERNLRNRYNGNDNPGPDVSNPQSNPPDSNSDSESNEDNKQKVLEDKLNYLYTINNTVEDIDKYVRLLTEVWTQGSSLENAFSDLKKESEDTDKSNNDFISDLLGSGQGSSGDFLQDLIKILIFLFTK